MAKVSAIISAYYCADFLQARLDNLKGQGCEIVVVAQQDSIESNIASKAKVTLVETRLIPTIYKAWNLGITASSGEYITNANSDDTHYSGMIQHMAKTLDRNPKYALVYSDIDMTKEIGGEPSSIYKNAKYAPRELMNRCFIGPMPMWRKSLHDKYGLFDDNYQVAGDYEFWLRIASKGEKFFYLPKSVGIYVDRPDSAEHRQATRTLWETARAKSNYRSNKSWQ